jgi:hypothetical protein
MSRWRGCRPLGDSSEDQQLHSEAQVAVSNGASDLGRNHKSGRWESNPRVAGYPADMNAQYAVAVRARYYARPGRRAIAVLDQEVVVGEKVRAGHLEPRDYADVAAVPGCDRASNGMGGDTVA